MFGKDKEVWLVAGLGNPGDKYAYTWHNCGFLALEILADKLNITLDKTKHKGLFGKGRLGDKEVMLVKPQTFMNNSGECIAEMASYYKIDPAHIIVIYDDIDIALGKIRVRAKGSAGTHNGMRSIIKLLGTENFPRIRIGYGPVPEHWQLIDYVLSEPTKEQRPMMMEAFTEAADQAIKWIEEN